MECEAALDGIGTQAENYLADAFPEVPADGQNRTELDHDLEYFALFVGVIEQIPRHDQMAGGRDGQEFGQPLDDAEDGRFQQLKHGNLSTLTLFQ